MNVTGSDEHGAINGGLGASEPHAAQSGALRALSALATRLAGLGALSQKEQGIWRRFRRSMRLQDSFSHRYSLGNAPIEYETSAATVGTMQPVLPCVHLVVFLLLA